MPRESKRARLERQMENLLVLQAMFKDIPRENVYLGLWANGAHRVAVVNGENPLHACGSTACVGGWAAIHPHFQAQGIRPGPDGEPEFVDERKKNQSVSDHLFGYIGMFDGMNYCTPPGGPDKEEVSARIAFAMSKVAEEMAELDRAHA